MLEAHLNWWTLRSEPEPWPHMEDMNTVMRKYRGNTVNYMSAVPVTGSSSSLDERKPASLSLSSLSCPF